MGQAFATLTPAVRQFHSLQGAVILQGHCRIQPSQSYLTRALCLLLGLPTHAFSGEFQFELRQQFGQEIWLRRFPGRSMRSVMQFDAGRLIERLGPVRLFFNLIADQGRLEMQLKRVSVFGVPIPQRLMPIVWGREHGSEGKIHFNAGADWGKLGRLAAYSGWLNLP